MNPYPEYKEAGIRWITNVPKHWDVKPLFAIMGENKVTNIGNIEQNVLSLSYGKIIQRDLSENFGLLPESFETYQIVQPGYIILRLTDLQNDKKSLRVGLVKEKGIITSAYIGLVSSSLLNSTYVYYLLHAYDLVKVFYGEGAGVRQSMTYKDLRRMPIIVPPLPEQQAIADFLDRKTAQIDMLIAKKQRQIDLLQEQRMALINQAVTKGLSHATPMRDSGIEWLGKIPSHWDLKRLGRITSLIMDIDHKMPDAVEEGIPFLSAKDLLNDGTLNFENDVKKISEGDFQKLSRKVQPQRNDIIYSRIGARLGKARLVETSQKFLVSYSCCVVRVLEEIALPEYVCFILDSELVLTEAKGRTVGIGVPDLGLGEIARFPIPLPPKPEQEKILNYLKRKDIQIRGIIKKVSDQIALLIEYRTALISEAVTGKIDV